VQDRHLGLAVLDTVGWRADWGCKPFQKDYTLTAFHQKEQGDQVAAPTAPWPAAIATASISMTWGQQHQGGVGGCV